MQGQELGHCPGQQEPEHQHSSVDKNTLPFPALQDLLQGDFPHWVVSQGPGVLIVSGGTLWNAGMREARR